jgi:hypothetical protein
MGRSKLRKESKNASKCILNKQRRTKKVALSFGSVIFYLYICIVPNGFGLGEPWECTYFRQIAVIRSKN